MKNYAFPDATHSCQLLPYWRSVQQTDGSYIYIQHLLLAQALDIEMIKAH